ncbi:MAG TPA: Fe-S cluster assembly protein SufB [Candidatus Limnocylindrales bacterium]|nr:Fe-S cluster assembly protein SufB [Candidatus Limnocylindrales bacterium]
MALTQREIVANDRSKFDFKDEIVYLRETKRGLTRDTVEEISRFKDEPEWMLKFRLRAYDHFLARPMPTWGADLSHIDFDRIVYYRKPSEREEKSWDDVPEQIKATFERLGIPEAERKFLSGVGAQYDSEVVYHSVREELTKIGVVFMGTDQGLKEYPEIFEKYFGTVVPPEDNKFAALNSAVWSGGSFVYVPKGVEVPLPLQAYFRINGENTGQFERTLIVVDEGAKVHYIEGCTAPIYATDSLHAAVVEVIALPGSKVRYTTIQNWSNDVYNLVTKRAHAHENATVEWIDANTGCLTGDTLVARGSDHVPISAIRTGDQVVGLGSDLSLELGRVTATKENRPQAVFEVEAGGRVVRATPNHPFLVRRAQAAPMWLPVASIVPGDLVAIADGSTDFSPVSAMRYAGEQVTYDIEVAGTHNFVANGVFVHNSRVTMKYPSIYLRGRGATADIISVAVAGKGQHQDTGAKAVHLAPDTKSRIVSKSVSKDGGRATYRGQLKVAPGATNVVASVRCDALMLDDQSRSDTYPYIDIQEDDTHMSHEATVGKISQDQVFYLMSRGLTENEAQNLIVQGFLEVFTKELPMEYAIEFNRLVKLEMEGALG